MNQLNRSVDQRVFVISLIVATVLMVVPFPTADFRPYWFALVVIYWIMESDRFRKLGVLFALGLMLDLLTNALFGQHALSLLVLGYILLRFYQRIRFYPMWQMTGVMLLLFLNDRILQLWVYWLSSQPPSLSYWASPVVSALLWPCVFLTLDSLRSRVKQAAKKNQQQ